MHMAGVSVLLRKVASRAFAAHKDTGNLLKTSADLLSAAVGEIHGRSRNLDSSALAHDNCRYARIYPLALSGEAHIQGGKRVRSSGLEVCLKRVCSLRHGAQPGARGLSGWLYQPALPIANGKYEIQESLGRGAFGQVYRGLNVETKQIVAIKVLDKEALLGPKTKKRKRVGGWIQLSATATVDPLDDQKLERKQERLVREIHAMMSVRHPHITRLYDVTATTAKIFLVMEYSAGGDLSDEMKKHTRIPEVDARKYFQHLIDAVHFCHCRGVFHRDLKPENLLLTEDGDLKVADFGLAVLRLDLDTNSIDPQLHYAQVGTAAYFAPEVILGAVDANAAPGSGYSGATADLWACGIILYKMLAPYQDHPFEGNAGFTNRADMFKKIMLGRLAFPSQFPKGAKTLVAGLLDVNPRTRMTAPEIYENEWFMTNYIPPSFHQIEEVKVSLKAIESIFMQPPWKLDESISVQPRTVHAFDLLSETAVAPVDQGLAPYFRRPGQDFTIQEETRYTSKLPPHEILQRIQAAVTEAGFQVQIRGFHMKMDGPRRRNAMITEPLCVTAEVCQLVPGMFMLVTKKITGEGRNYQAFSQWLSDKIKDTIVEFRPR